MFRKAMMKYLMFACWLLAACNSNNKKTGDETGSNHSVADTAGVQQTNNMLVDGCYLQVIKRDTIAASLQQQGNNITGKMSFNYFEKDASAGTVSGTLKGDILILNYNFSSEGMQSVMQLYLKYKEGSLINGTGEMNTKHDTAYFVNPAEINYSDSGLKKIACELLPANYK